MASNSKKRSLNSEKSFKKRKIHLNAKDIFALNSPTTIKNVDSHVNDLLSRDLSKYGELNLILDKHYVSFLPYITYWLLKIKKLEFSLPLKRSIQVETVDTLKRKNDSVELFDADKFLDLLRFENAFNEKSDEIDLNVDVTNLIALNNSFFENVDDLSDMSIHFDLFIKLPEEMYKDDDYLNYSYFIKRGALIYRLYQSLKSLIDTIPVFDNPKVNSNVLLLMKNIVGSGNFTESCISKCAGVFGKVKVEVEYLNGLSYIPTILVTFLDISLKNDPLSFAPKSVTFRLNTVNSRKKTFPVSDSMSLVCSNSVRLSITNNDSLAYPTGIDPNLLPPTPQYNGAVYNEEISLYEKSGYKRFIPDFVMKNPLLVNSFILIKFWCIKMGIWDNITLNKNRNGNNSFKKDAENQSEMEDYRSTGLLNSEIILCFLFHSYLINGNFIDDSKISPFQLFRLVLINVRDMILNWKKGLNKDDNSNNSGVFFVIGDSDSRTIEKCVDYDECLMNNNFDLFNKYSICKQVFILFEEQSQQNILWRCQDLIKSELESVITSTLLLIENKDMRDYANNILKLFNISEKSNMFINYKNISLLDYDSCLMITSNRGNTMNGIKLRLAYTIPGFKSNNKIITYYKSKKRKSNKSVSCKLEIERNLDVLWENCRSTNLVEVVRNLFSKCLEDRLKTLSIREVVSKSGSFGCIIGLKFEQSISRCLIKGPTVNSKESLSFKEFWGDKVETRRFKDGTVLETVLWDFNLSKVKEGFMSNEGINYEIIKYSLNKHLPVIYHNEVKKKEDNNLVLYYLNTPFGFILPFTRNEKCINDEFNAFKDKILGLKSLPLKVKSITTSSPILRFMEYYNYVNMDDRLSQNMEMNIENNGYTGLIDEIPCIIELEQSINWPKTKSSIDKIKTAFLLQIKKELSEFHSTTADIVPNNESCNTPHIKNETVEFDTLGNVDLFGLKPFLDIYWKHNITFRVCIFHTSEFLTTAKRVLDLTNINNDLIKKNMYMTVNELKEVNQFRNLWWSIQLSSRLSNISHCFPSFRGTVKKLKEFASNINISDSEEFIEHIAAYVYTNNDFINNFHERIHSPTCGFIRSLALISEFNWRKSPLIVDLDYKIEENGVETRMNDKNFEDLDRIHTYYYNFTNKHKIERKLFYVSSLIDPQSLLIRVPSKYNSLRFVYLSKLFLNIIMENQLFLSVTKVNNLLLNNKPKCDFIITLNDNYKQIIQPGSRKVHSNVDRCSSNTLFQGKYVNLNTTEELIKMANLKSNPLNISREIFQMFIIDIQKLWNHKIDLIYDSYTIPYPKYVYAKISPGIVRKGETLQPIISKGSYPECIFYYTNKVYDSDSKITTFIALPNLIELFSNLTEKYRELITNIEII